MNRFIRTLQPISLRIGEGEGAGWYPSQVLDIDDGREIRVAAPTHREEEVRVEPGTLVDVQTTHPEGLHVFAAAVLGRAAGPAPALRLAWPRSVQRVQRREAVRVEVEVPVELRVPGPGAEPRVVGAVTLDVSEGGMRFALAEPVQPGGEVEVRLHLPGGGAAECAGRVLRGGESEGEAPGRRFWGAVEFTAVPPAARRELTRFVFETQREQLRRGVA